MIKIFKTMLSISLIFLGLKNNAQVSAYSFSQLAGSYNAIPISGPTTTLIAIGNQDDNVYSNIPIGFNFNMNGTAYSSVALNVNGWICMGTVTPFSSYTPISTGSASNVVSFYSRDLQLGPYQSCTTTIGSNVINFTYPAASNYFVVGDTISGTGIPLNASVTAISAGNMTISAPATAAGTSVFTKGYISYQLSGVTPNQVFTIQWRRYGRWSNSSTGLDDYLNTQIKLYQTTDVIEVIYGTCGTNSPNSFTGEIGLRGTSNADFNNRSILAAGAYNASSAGIVNSATGVISSTLAPVSGQIYRWTPPNPCAGVPNAGIVSPSSSICPNTTAVISNTSSNSFTGITYQWWQAPAFAGPYTMVSTGSGFNTPVLTTASLTSLTFYKLVITCTNSALSATTAVTSVNPNNPANLCYCVLNLNGSGCTGDNISNVSILGTSFNNNSTCNSNALNGTYTQFPLSPSTTATLSAGVSYSLSVTTTANNIESVWIDYNQNGIYDPSEHTQICLSSISNTATIVVFTVPLNATLGQTGMRIRSRAFGNINGPTDPCTAFFSSGETEDYIVTIAPATACAGAPGANTAVTSLTNVCPNGTATLSLVNTYTVGGLTYQWSTATSSVGPYTSVSGATNTAYTATNITVATWYQCVITCTNGPSSTTAAPVQIMVSSNPCACSAYCASAATSVNDDEIFNVSFGTLNNTSSCAQTGGPGSTLKLYSNYTGILAAPNIIAGSNYTLAVTVGQCNANAYNGGVTAYIDYNQNGVFTDPGEQVYASISTLFAVTGTSLSTVITVPASASPGITRMRVIAVEGTTGAASCLAYTWGETEDYCINITAATACAGAPAANSVVASATNVCPNGSSNFSLATSYTIGGLTYQWSVATNSVGPYSAVPAATLSVYSATNIAASTWFQCVITCTNGPVSTTATPVQVLVGGSSCQCAAYCVSAAGSTADDEIFNVSIGTLNNTSNCSQTGGPTSTLNVYSNYAGIIAAPNLAINSTYTLDVTVGQCNAFAYSGGVTVYMDFNQNGSFADPGEQVFVSPTTTFAIAGTLVSTVITVPATASLGTTRMRVIAEEGNTGTGECATYTWGETEDYCIQITAGCSVPNVTLAASQTTICNGVSVNLVASGATTYTWNTSATTSSISVTPSVTTTYTVVGENSPGCPDTKTVSIIVNPSPVLSVTAAPGLTICPGATATLTANSSANTYSWSPGSFTTAAISVTPAISSVYNVVSTNSVGCTTNSNVTVFVVVCTGLAKNTVIDNKTFLYPNPNNGNINVVVENANGNYLFEILDLAGRLVYKITLSKAESALNIKELANGMYTYKITSLTNKIAIKEGKLIKE